MPEELGERTEMPTPRRLAEARERGQTGKSADLSSAVFLCGACAVVWFSAGRLLDYGLLTVRRSLDPGVLGATLRAADIQSDTTATLTATAFAVLPIMLMIAGVSYLAQVWQVGFMFTTRPLEPKLSRLNLVSGFGRLFSLRSTVKGGLDLLKLTLIVTVCVLVIRSEAAAIASLAALDLAGGMFEALRITARVAAWVLVILLILGVIDRVYQKWQLQKDLRMTKQEVKDEMRSQEGDIEVKGRRLKMMRSLIMQRLNKDVPKADVVVANPTHFSVAIAYSPGTMNAPKVVAKGADYLALKIRYIAASHGVPIVERPPLARALYAQAEVGREISPEHYEAVAEVLAYVYRLEGRALTPA